VAWFFSVCAVVVLAMLGCYAFLERRTRDHWQRFEQRERLPLDDYRVNQQPTYEEVLVRDRAPAVVRLAAASAQIFGITFVPGLLFAVAGCFVYGVGLLGVPGLVVAWCQFPVSAALLRRDAGAPRIARRLADLATALNLLIVLGTGMVVVPLVAGECISGSGTMARELVPPILPLLAWALLSLGQAALLRAAASLVERDIARQREDDSDSFTIGL
jgi:hypothetical protein